MTCSCRDGPQRPNSVSLTLGLIENPFVAIQDVDQIVLISILTNAQARARVKSRPIMLRSEFILLPLCKVSPASPDPDQIPLTRHSRFFYRLDIDITAGETIVARSSCQFHL
jgi:hypothetical protein